MLLIDHSYLWSVNDTEVCAGLHQDKGKVQLLPIKVGFYVKRFYHTQTHTHTHIHSHTDRHIHTHKPRVTHLRVITNSLDSPIPIFVYILFLFIVLTGHLEPFFIPQTNYKHADYAARSPPNLVTHRKHFNHNHSQTE